MPWYLETHLLSTLLAMLTTLGIYSIVMAAREQSAIGRLVLCGLGGCAFLFAFNI